MVIVGRTTQQSPSSLVSEDFDQCAAVNSPTEAGNRIIPFIGSPTSNITPAGLQMINTTGITMLGLREGHDTEDIPISNDTTNLITFYTSNASNQNFRPKMQVTYINKT